VATAIAVLSTAADGVLLTLALFLLLSLGGTALGVPGGTSGRAAMRFARASAG